MSLTAVESTGVAPGAIALRTLGSAVSRSAEGVLLASGLGFGHLGQLSIAAVRPLAIFQASDTSWHLSDAWPGPRPDPNLAPLEALERLLAATRRDDRRRDRFDGGWIGLIAYDVAPWLERVPRRWPRSTRVPDLYFAYVDAFAVVETASGRVTTVCHDPFRLGQRYRSDRLAELHDAVATLPLADDGAPLIDRPLASNFAPDEYCHAIERILEYLRAGDIFQANFTHRFSAPFCGDIERLVVRSLEKSPAPFAAVIQNPEWSVVSTSPERFFFHNANGRIETRPIKGTRPRGRDAVHDLWLREELRTSDKDLAELTMIVDLERNDLGRLCRYGTVRVERHAAIESFANVHHLVSTVSGQLRPDVAPVEVLRALFPGGSITGAPKIRAMEILDELERCRRGVYTGAIGYWSDSGRADFNIAIRTAVVEDNTVHYHVGGGIVIDSDPLTEYRESLVKGRKLEEILTGAAGLATSAGVER